MGTKNIFRKTAKSALLAHSPSSRKAKSRRIREKLFGLGEFRRAGTVCFYVSLPAEVDTRDMIETALEQGKKVLVPLSNLKSRQLELYEIKDFKKDLKKGTLGIREPRPERTRRARAGEVECAVVPGLVFDKTNHRLGRGAGFYDRFLKKLKRAVPKIGLAYSFQVVESVPVEKHDVKLDKVLTD